MDKKKRHRFNAKELFMEIDRILETEGRKPGIIDYGIGGDVSQELFAETFDIIPRVCYGGCEGIYLDIRLEDHSGKAFGGDRGAIILGTYKTLCTKKNDYIAMCLLGAEFVFALDKFVQEHMDDFNWTGYDVRLQTDKDTGYTIWTSNHESAEKRAMEFLSQNPHGEAWIRDNGNGERSHFRLPA